MNNQERKKMYQEWRKRDQTRRTSMPVQRVIDYINATPAAISGSGGHDQTFKLAVALVHGFALSAQDAYSMLATYYNPRCEPPWSEAELRHKAQSAYATAPRAKRGYLI